MADPDLSYPNAEPDLSVRSIGLCRLDDGSYRSSIGGEATLSVSHDVTSFDLPCDEPWRVASMLADLLGGLGLEKLSAGLRYVASLPNDTSRVFFTSQSRAE